MRILYIVTAFPRTPGDVITPWLIETIKRLGERGVEVEVLAPSYRGLDDQVVHGITIHRFRYAPARLETLTHDQTTPDRIREKPWYLALVPSYVAAGSLAAIRLSRGGRFDVVHCFWPLPHGLFGLAARWSTGTPLVSTFFGVELTWLRRQLPLLSPLVRAIIRRSDAVTVISSHTAREVKRLSPDASVRTIPFGAAVAAPRVKPKSDHIEPSSANDSAFQLLFVGRLVERKGVGVLLSAVARLRERGEIRLAVVGDGPLRTSLEREAVRLGLSDLVEFTGFISEDEIRRRFEECDAFVLPAVEDAKGDVEGLGVVLIEAMLHDRPVVASASGGIPDIVIDGRTGLLTDPGDVDALCEAIWRLRSDVRLRDDLVRAARAHVAEHFSWDTITDRLVALYDDLSHAGTTRRSRGVGTHSV